MENTRIVLTEDVFQPGKDVWQTVQNALDSYRQVEIGKVSFPLMLSRALVMHSGNRLYVDPETELKDLPGCGGTLLRNENVTIGSVAPEEDTLRDEDMIVEGGIWAPGDPTGRSYVNDPHPAMQALNKRGTLLGVIYFCNARNIVVRKLTVREATAYAVLICRCDDFVTEDLFFERHRKDGVHVNGPSHRGVMRRLRGKCGDDIVALNAWDWHSSAVCYGPITHMLVEDLNAEHDEMRLLPGKKLYDNGDVRDCPISDIVFRRMSGLYSIKMYQQPYYLNKRKGLNDRSLTAGLMENILFEDIDIAGNTNEAMSEVILDAFWEIGADAKNIVWRNIRVGAAVEDFTALGMTLSNIGPKSSTYTEGNPDPETWQELFEPDLICRGEDLVFENVTFAGIPCTDRDVILKEVQLTPNPDYPRTTPMGGTGYGTAENLVIR